MRRASFYFVLLLIASGSVVAQSRQDLIREARDLFYAAAYEQALATLDHIEVTRPDDAITVEQYRAACLLALGRTGDAEQSFERLVALAPDIRPDELDVAPWIRTRFAEVRARVLRRLDQERQVQNPVTRVPSATQEESVFYTIDDESVRRPIPLTERVSEPPSMKGVDFKGSVILQVDIAIDGTVETVTVDGVIHPIYQSMLVEAASRWRYLPARLDGKPVRFRKALKIEIS